MGGEGSVLGVVHRLHIDVGIELLYVRGDNPHQDSLVVGVLDQFQSTTLDTRIVNVSFSVESGEDHADPSDVITVAGLV